jgi:hypothetical protein
LIAPLDSAFSLIVGPGHLILGAGNRGNMTVFRRTVQWMVREGKFYAKASMRLLDNSIGFFIDPPGLSEIGERRTEGRFAHDRRK